MCDNKCLECKLERCVLDTIKPKKKKDRKEYYHIYYMRRKQGKTMENICKMCGKEVIGEMIRVDGKNYCSIDCVLCHLYDKAEKHMKIINVGG